MQRKGHLERIFLEKNTYESTVYVSLQESRMSTSVQRKISLWRLKLVLDSTNRLVERSDSTTLQ